jgi:hypothetical protein
MRGISRLRWLAGVVAVACALVAGRGGPAWADCTVTSVTSVSPASYNVGTYGTGSTLPSPPSSTRQLSFSVRAVAVSNGNQTNAINSNCDVRVVLRRPTMPASMTTNSGPAALPYSATISGDAMVPGSTAVASNPGNPANPGTLQGTLNGSTPVTLTFAADFAVTLSNPTSTPTVGSGYLDTLFFDIYNWPQSNGAPNRRQLVGTITFNPTATVTQSCSIANPQNVTNQVFAVAANGTTTGQKTGGTPSFNVSCTGRSNVSLTSANGAVTRGNVPIASLGTASGSFRNRIHYTASVNGGAGAVTLNTASAATSGLAAFSTSVLSNSATTVAITPETITSATPLLAGTYGDTLTISIVPQ